MASFFHSKAGKTAVGIEDMVLLPRVSDSEIVENLKKRQNESIIYTYIGPILVSINPYKKLDIYGLKKIECYQGAATHDNSPHVFAIADQMYRNLLAEGENQCVIISGESGAGKTEAAKLVINYLAAVSGRSKEIEYLKQIILESNPLLESFGNARTLRNNNSSRFGKYFEIQFSRTGGVPIGGQILNFLLEKSRVVGQQKGERSFHIFYQLTKGATDEERKALGLMKPEDYFYLNQSGTFDATGIDDIQDFDATRYAMEICGISLQQQHQIFSILAAILHLGNIDFVEASGGGGRVRNPATLEFPAYLLGVSTELLNAKLTTRKMTAAMGNQRSSTYDVELNVDQANYTRDALAKTLYSRLFDWIVEAVNRAMGEGGAKKKEDACTLGVLDIYGFEIFDRNGFSQFCINFVNEKLQQVFIQLTLKSEQEEYLAEGIQWTPVAYFNNEVVVDLIEGKNPVGVMAVLDDLCATMHGQSEGADGQFGQKLNMIMKGNPNSAHFVALQDAFVLKHYAGEVTYDLDGFVDANRDTLFRDLVILMKSTNQPFILTLFPEAIDADDRRRPTTAGHKIRTQASQLVETLSRCVPHYIRCIKPNETKKAGDWDSQRVQHQVQYLNLKENIHIRRAGFAYRESYEKFLKRFAILTSETFPTWRRDARQGVTHILDNVGISRDAWQLGRTKVFIKAPESLEILEDLREKTYGRYAAIIQRAWRRHKARQNYKQLRIAVNNLFYGKKDRRRFSLNREYYGDYLGVRMCSGLKPFLSGRNEKVLFSNSIIKYDRRFRQTLWDFIITDQAVLLIGDKVITEGIDKEKSQKVLKKRLGFDEVRAISLSTKADDFFVLHCIEYDYFLCQLFKTEMIAIFMDAYRKQTRVDCEIRFASQLVFRVKKIFWEREGKRTVNFVSDNGTAIPSLTSKGKMAIVYVPMGLSNTSVPLLAVSNAVPRKNVPTQEKTNEIHENGVSYSPTMLPAMQNKALLWTYRHNEESGQSNNNTPLPHQSGPLAVFATNLKNVQSSISQTNGNLPNTAMSASFTSTKTKPPVLPPPKPKLTKARALFDYGASETDELSFIAGDVITILNQQDEGWWQGILRGKKGLVPSNYLTKLEIIQ